MLRRILLFMLLLHASIGCWAGAMTIVLRDYLNKPWTNELLVYPFTAPRGACDAHSVTLAGPNGAVPAQLADIVYWPGTTSVKSAKLYFIANLAPLATDTYVARYGKKPVAPPATDVAVITGNEQVEMAATGFGARVLLGAKTYAQPVASAQVPGPVIAMRMADGAWFGGSSLYGPAAVKSYSATVTDNGPVFARVAICYTYDNGNTLDVVVRLVTGDNTVRFETNSARRQPDDGFTLLVSKGLPPMTYAVQDEARKDRPCFPSKDKDGWAYLPLKDYTGPQDGAFWPPIPNTRNGLVTALTPWEDWFGTFTSARIRLLLENSPRELQIRSVDPGAWVEPTPIADIFSPKFDPDPAKGIWAAWQQKMLPLVKTDDGTIVLRVNAEYGARKWTVSDCQSVPGLCMIFRWAGYKQESTFPAAARPTIGSELDRVKDCVLSWPDKAGAHPLLFISRKDLEAKWGKHDVDPKLMANLLLYGKIQNAQAIYDQYMPNSSTNTALGAYLLSGYAPEVAEQTQMLARLKQALNYELWGYQFGCAGNPTPILYDGVIDSPVVPANERSVLRAQMAYYAYRLADPAVWSAERGYCSGNQNMTVTWEISRGITACVIPDHPMARAWYRKAEQIMEYFLEHMVGPAGEWPESMGQHGRQSIDMLLAFAVASSHSGLHDYVNDPRVKHMVTYWAKMLSARDPRPRGWPGAQPNRRTMPAMGRDAISMPGGTCGVLARLLAQSDPALSSDLQWAWVEEGASESLNHLGGFSYVSCDKTLPSTLPNWTSEVLPYAGTIFRHGFGAADEHQVMLYSGDHFAAFYPGHAGSFPNIYAYGVPVAGSWPGSYEDQEELLLCHVGLARGLGTMTERNLAGFTGCAVNANMWSWPSGQLARLGAQGGLANISSFSTLPRQDYAAVDVALHFPRSQTLPWRPTVPEWPPVPANGKPPVDWRRQTLFLKDDDPANTAYLLIRDSVKGVNGPQPTIWQMWTVSETLDTPEKVRDVAAVLKAKPGYQVLPSRALQGNRFTAIGQLGVDVEYYIVSPTDTPRHTLRWGTEFVFQNTNKLPQPEYQDLLHLQLPGDGVYYVAFFPHKRATPAPVFSTLGNGLIIKVSGDFGTDYGFLSASDTTAAGEGASFTGTAASVQDRAGVPVLTLGAKGQVNYKGIGFAADFPCSLRVKANALSLELPATIQPPAFQLAQPFPGGTVTITAPGAWTLIQPRKGVKLIKTTDGWVLTVSAGVRRVELASH